MREFVRSTILNFDSRSFSINDEANVNVYDSEFSQ